MNNALHYLSVEPAAELAAFVDSFWLLHNPSDAEKEVIILPDGRIDLFLSRSATEPFHITQLGIGTQPERASIAPRTQTFAISFKVPAVEYLFHESLAPILDKGRQLPVDFWQFQASDLADFGHFCAKATAQLKQLLPATIDERKHRLFTALYASKGALTVQELSEKAAWSSRQINRYFNEQYGLSLKTYCTILRFRASFQHIHDGELFPQENFTDQSHFIREIRRLSGSSPKELNANKNDRFIQFSTLHGR